MTEANARFQGSIPELYEQHLGPVIFEPYAEDLARQLERLTRAARSPTARSFAIGLVKGNPVCLAIQERGGALEPIVDALAAALVRIGGDHPFRSTMQAIVVTARARGA